MTVKPFSRLNYTPRNYNIVSAVMVPVYNVSASSLSINEGTAVTYTITTQYVLDGTILYWTTSGTTVAADFSDGVTSGSITMTNGTATVVRTLTSDILTEGAETIVFELRTVSTSGTIVASTPSGTVNDTSVLTITPDVSSMNEGATVTWTINAIGFGTGTLYYTNSGTTSAADFTDGVNSGSIAITADSGTLTKTLQNDLSTDGSETIIMQIRTGSTSGTVVGTSATVTVADTSISVQSYSVKFNGSTQYLSITSTAISNFGTGDFTVEGWFYTNSVSTLQGVYDGRPLGTSTGAYPSVFIETSTLKWYTNAGTQIASSTLLSNTWYHFAIVRISGSTKMYINGAQAGSTYTDATTYVNGASTIGYLGGNSAYPFNGYISNFRIVKGTGVYTANFNPPTDSLVAITNTVLLTCNLATISDSSSNAFTITNNNTAIVSMENPFGDYSMWFTSGSSRYLTIASNANLALGTGDFTVEFWVFLNAYAPSNYGLFDQRNGTNGVGVVQPNFSVDTTNGYLWYVTAGVRISSGTAAVAVQRWQHLAVVRASGTTRMYLDGIQVGSNYTDSNNYPAGSITIGRQNDGVNTNYLNGYMSNVRVVKGTAVYTAAFTPPTAALTAINNTQLLTCQYAELYDASTNKFAITNSGSTPASPQNPFGSYYASFNGSSQYLTVPYNANQAFGTNDFTIEAWIRPTTVSSLQRIINSWYGVGGQFIFDLTAAGKLYLNYTTTGDVQTNTTTTTGITANVWTHVAVVRNGATITFYINGVADATTRNIGAGTSIVYYGGTQKDIIIGSLSSADYFNGGITNLRMVIGTAVYTGAFTPPTTPLTSTQSSGTNISAITGTSTTLLTCQYADIVDASTNKFAITNTGSVKTYLTDTFTGVFSGVNYAQKNHSLKLNGSSQYLTVPTSSFLTATNTYTIEMWINPTAYPGGTNSAPLYCILNNNVSFFGGLFLTLYGSGNINADVRPATGSGFANINIRTTSVVSLNTWTHVAFVVNSGAATIYLNGVSSATGTVVVLDGSQTSAGIGYTSNGYTSGQSYYSGYISNLRILKTVAQYTATFTPSTTPLKAITNTSLLTCQYNTLFDASNNKLALTRVSAPDMVNMYPFPV